MRDFFIFVFFILIVVLKLWCLHWVDSSHGETREFRKGIVIGVLFGWFFVSFILCIFTG